MLGRLIAITVSLVSMAAPANAYLFLDDRHQVLVRAVQMIDTIVQLCVAFSQLSLTVAKARSSPSRPPNARRTPFIVAIPKYPRALVWW